MSELNTLRRVRMMLNNHLYLQVTADNFTDNTWIIDALALIDASLAELDREFEEEE